MRAVGEDVAEMGVASRTARFDTSHSVARVFFLFHSVRFDRAKEAGPAGSGVELCFRVEEGCVAADTGVDTVRLAVVIFTSEGAFCPGLPADLILFGRQLCAPFLICFLNFL